jgi:formylglycine-generating enzyme required for sulfatase activity
MQGVAPGSVVKADVLGIEMVLVPGGPFWVGDGVSTGSFRQAANSTPFQVTAMGGVLKVEDGGCCDESQIKGAGIWVDGDGGVSNSSATETDMNPDFPTGFRGFYCMKYEITQGQYRDFLNTLTRSQQDTRTETNILASIISNRFVMTNNSIVVNRNGLRCDANLPSSGPIEIYCDLNENGLKNENNDGEWVACNFLSWADGAAYIDWSGLRPMTELEFEKSCRGPNDPVSGEYAWGTTGIAGSAYILTAAGQPFEGIGTSYSTTVGNANYNDTEGLIDGPLRVGIFAANGLNSGRVSSGAGYFGTMELSGNVWERSVSMAIQKGRNFTGVHGDGLLSAQGNADVLNWPETDSYGTGLRGGAWSNNAIRLKIVNRQLGAYSPSFRFFDGGFRGCRSVRVSSGGY